jgi:putative ABC transport system permease protein
MQFLGEATLLSLLGGAIGVLIGVVGSLAISSTLHWPTHIPIEALLVAVIFSAAVGVFFGFYPAYKASHLDPIEALRYE